MQNLSCVHFLLLVDDSYRTSKALSRRLSFWSVRIVKADVHVHWLPSFLWPAVFKPLWFCLGFGLFVTCAVCRHARMPGIGGCAVVGAYSCVFLRRRMVDDLVNGVQRLDLLQHGVQGGLRFLKPRQQDKQITPTQADYGAQLLTD
jgi:hypothetical protein